jgi:hypothetical protein
MGVGGVEFDVPARTVRLYCSDGVSAELYLRDEFVLEGPAPGTPVTLRLRIRYQGSAGGYGPSFPAATASIAARAIVEEPGDLPAAASFQSDYSGGVVDFSDSLDLALARTAGAPVGMVIHTSVAHGYLVNVTLELEFVDLPPGSTVTSCKGYLQEQPVPALTRSWGELKAAYR